MLLTPREISFFSSPAINHLNLLPPPLPHLDFLFLVLAVFA
jgi:hypothetical protein